MLFRSEQARERGLKVDLPRSDGVQVPGVGSPIRLSATPVEYRSAAPRLGEHSEDVLKEWLNASADEVARVRGSGALG